MAIAFFDLDGTLISGPASETRLLSLLLREGLIGPEQAWAVARFVLRWQAVYGRSTLVKNKAYLSGLAVTEVTALARLLTLPLRRTILDRLDGHRRDGHEIVLLTAAPDFIAQPLAEKLGCIHCIATQCASADGRFTADPPLRHPFSEDKRRLAAAFAALRGVPLDRCAAYGDAWHDMPLLKAVGQAVAVHPDPLLARHARRHGWDIIN